MHKVAIVGLGGAGVGHALRYWPLNHVRVEGICDIQPDLLERRRIEWNMRGVFASTDYEELLRKCDCDIVSICTPDHEHSSQAVRALATGRHVHLEKPVTSTRQELVSLCDASRQSRQMVGLHYQLRSFWLYRRIKELITQGVLGRVYAVEADYLHNIQVRTIGTSDWRERPETVQPIFAGAGGCHFVDLMRWFTEDEVERVYTVGNHFSWENYPKETHVTVLLEFCNGAIGKITVSVGSTLPKQHPTKVFGTKACTDDVFLFDSPHAIRPQWLGTTVGTLSNGRFRGPLTKALAFALRKVPVRLERYPFSSYSHVESCTATVANYINALDGREPLIGSLDEAAKTFCVCEAVERSLIEHQPVRVEYL